MAREGALTLSHTQFVLLLHSIPYLGEKTLTRLLRTNARLRVTPEEFLTLSPAEWQARYDTFLTDEVLPRMAALNDDPTLITVGASFGGYHALCFAMRYPHLVTRVLSMSGLPDIKRLTKGWSDDAVYFQNPADFMRHEHDEARLAAFRRMDIILAVGRDDSLCPSNLEFSQTLWDRGIGNALRVWDGWAHDWPYWHQMMAMYINGHD